MALVPSSSSSLSPLQTPPAEVRESPEYERAHGPAPRLGPVAHCEVGDDRGSEIDEEARAPPFFEARGNRREQQRHADQLCPGDFHPEPGGKPEMRERFGDL